MLGAIQLLGIIVLIIGVGVETRYLGTYFRLQGLLVDAFPSLIEVRPKTISLLLSPDEERQVEFQFTNRSPTSFSVVGGTIGCAPEFCIKNISLPVNVPPGTAKSVIISIGNQASPGSYSKEFVFYTSSRDQPSISISINIEVAKPR
jgi:hypothetical protein